MIIRRGLLVMGTALACSLATPIARAQCISPALSLLWSYPADGDQDVPTNAVFWAVATAYNLPKLSLDGVVLPTPDSTSTELALGALLPNHDYTLQLDYTPIFGGEPQPSDAGTALAFQISFRTGTGPAARLPAAPIQSVATGATPEDSTCPEIVRAGECFDTGPDVLFTFDVSSPDAIGWLVHGKPWPARCGKPAAYVGPIFRSAPCTEVAPIGPGGLLGPVQTYCPAASKDAGAPGVALGVGDGGTDASFHPVPASDAAVAPTDGVGDLADSDKRADDGSCNASGHSFRGGSISALLLSLASMLLIRRRKA